MCTLHGKIGDFLLVDVTSVSSGSYPIFSTTTYMRMTMSMSLDVVDSAFKMTAAKPELEITLER